MKPSYDDLIETLSNLLKQMPPDDTKALEYHVARPEIEAGRKMLVEVAEWDATHCQGCGAVINGYCEPCVELFQREHGIVCLELIPRETAVAP